MLLVDAIPSSLTASNFYCVHQIAKFRCSFFGRKPAGRGIAC